MVFASVRDNRTFSVPNPALTPSRKPLCDMAPKITLRNKFHDFE